MQLTRHELRGEAEFLSDSSFQLRSCPFPEKAAGIPLGLYELPRRSGEAHLYRLSHPLAEALLTRAKGRDLPSAEVRFAYGDHAGKVTLLETLIGKSGWLTLCLFSVESLDQAEDHPLFAAATDQGEVLDQEAAARLMTLPGAVAGETSAASAPTQMLNALMEQRQAAIQRGISERNARYFEAEAEKLDGWADDMKLGLEREIKDLDRQIKEARRATTTALTLEEKLAGQKQIKALETQRNEKRRSLFDAQDDVERRRDQFIADIEGKLKQQVSLTTLFQIRWTLN